MNINIKKLLIISLIVTSCEATSTDTCNSEVIVCSLSIKYPEYEIMNSSFFIEYDLHTDIYDDSIFTAKISTDPLIHSADLNNDGLNEYFMYIYRIGPNLNTPSKDDLIYSIKGVLAFSDGNDFSYNDTDIYTSTGVYYGMNTLLLEENTVFLKPGYYRRGYPFFDSTYINTTGLVLYSPLGMAVTEWKNSTTFEITPFYVN